MAGIRFHQLIRQLMDDGWSATDIAHAIGCHQTLVSKWGTRHARDERSGITDSVIQGIYDGLQVSADYLFIPVPKNYHGQIRLKNGEMRKAAKHELDHKEFRVGISALSGGEQAQQIPAEHTLALRSILAGAAKAERGARYARERLQELLGIAQQEEPLTADGTEAPRSKCSEQMHDATTSAE